MFRYSPTSTLRNRMMNVAQHEPRSTIQQFLGLGIAPPIGEGNCPSLHFDRSREARANSPRRYVNATFLYEAEMLEWVELEILTFAAVRVCLRCALNLNRPKSALRKTRGAICLALDTNASYAWTAIGSEAQVRQCQSHDVTSRPISTSHQYGVRLALQSSAIEFPH